MFGAVFLILCLVSTACTQSTSEAERHRVVVVGAGVSGLTTAATLLENHIDDVIILEAADRIGGRIHTVEYGGIAVDKGAEFVHGEVDNAVFEMVKPYDLLFSYNKTFFNPENQLFTNTAGDDFNSTYVVGLLNEALGLFESDHLLESNKTLIDFYNSGMDDIITSKEVDPKLGEGIRQLGHLLQLILESADNLTDVGVTSFYAYEDNEGDTSLTWKKGGYKTLFDFITKKFPNPAEELPVLNKTLLGKQVTLISRKDGVPEGEEGVEVKCADGSSYLAHHVVVTTSLGVLKKHAHSMFQPALPAQKIAAIETIGFGCVGKVFVLFPTRWWPKDIHILIPLFSQQEFEDFKNNSVHGSWSAYSSGLYPMLNSDRMLLLWFTGPACRTMELLSDEQVIDGVQEFLQHTFGKKFDIPRPESVLKSSWASNPFTLGSYSYSSVESDRLQLNTTHLAAPVLDNNNKPVILFAGEATNPTHYSTVHGALATGRREAQHIINYTKSR